MSNANKDRDDRFYQEGPASLANQFDSDAVLKSYLQRVLPADVLAEIEPNLSRFGSRVAGDVLQMAEAAEAEEPRLIAYDPWGRRIDRIEVSHGWRELDRVAAEEGLVAIGYERRHGEYSRLHQFAKLFLFDPSSAIYSCPLAMTDGAARLIEVHGDKVLTAGALRHLTTRDPAQFWTSGQWMTERPGGSDVGRTETVARRVGSCYQLHGDKWFTSATTSQMAMTLARILDDQGHSTPGSRGLSLFYLETRDATGALNSMRINRLKDKLGTRALPTAELTLAGTPARLVGEPGAGVKNIATLFNVTRIYNAVCAAAKMRRGLVLARSYAHKRLAFGKPLAEHALHVETLAALELEARAGFHLVFSLIEMLGRIECGKSDGDDTRILRLLTPVAKLYTAKQAVQVTSEVLECFGGAGYIEDTGLPQLLRNAQVLPIWEGTTNVLSLDVLRAIEREQALAPFLANLDRTLAAANAPALDDARARVRAARDRIAAFAVRLAGQEREQQEAAARAFAFAIARTHAAACLITQADWAVRTGRELTAVVAAQRWCRQELAPLPEGALDLGGSRCLGLGDKA